MELELDRVSAGYGSTTVVRDLSLRICGPEILGVLGRNGMGKTTLIRCLAGTIRASAGSIRLDGREITQLPPHERARLGITTVVQGRGIFPQLTVRENLEIGRIALRRPRSNRLEEVLGYFKVLGERLSQLGGTLSGGEQQMLAIGRSLMTDPKVLLLDEPSEGIMPILVKQIGRILQEINRREKIMIIIVEQNVPLVFGLTDHCIIMEKGRTVADGTPQELSNSAVMKEYLAI